MIKADQYYIDNLKQILAEMNKDENPRPKYKDGVPAHSYFITQVYEKYDLSKGEFPITTLRNTAIKTGIREVLWIYQKQDSSLETAKEMKIGWWDEWDIGDGTIGARYGQTVNNWDLVNRCLKGLEENPFGRRHVINLLQEQDLRSSEGLYPCAFETMYSVRKNDGMMYLDLTLNQRSQDSIMATYINKIQYVALQMMFAKHLGFEVGVFAHHIQNYHIYDRHLNAAQEILDREPLDYQPYIKLNTDKTDFYSFTIDDFEIYTSKDIKKLSSELEIAV